MSDNLNTIRTFIALPVDIIDDKVFEKPAEQYEIGKIPSSDSLCVVEINQFDDQQQNEIQNDDLLQNSFVDYDNQNMILDDGTNLKNDIEENKKNSSTFKCSKCNEVFNKMTLCHKHMIWHHNIKKYKCTKCAAGYNIEINFIIHMAIHEEGKPVCPICKISFQRVASLKSHLLLHQVEEFYTCEECAQEFEKENDLIKHLQNHIKVNNNNNNNLDNKLTCSYCNIQFDEDKLYKEHISHHIKIKKIVLSGRKSRKVHTNKEYSHVCSVCLKSFSRVSLLERHLRVHSGERPFVCPHCNRGFNQKGTLQIHLSKHTGVKPFHCTLCSARFNQKGNLRVHVEKTHTAPVPGEKMYKCSHCTCIFKKIASLNVHITKFHAAPEDTTEDISNVMSRLKELEEQTNLKMEENKKIGTKNGNDDRSYVKLAESFLDGTVRQYLVMQKRVNHVRFYICTYCEKEFKKPSDLIRHTRVHTKEKPFVCKQCGASFALKSTLFCHIKTHSIINTCVCNICKKKFSSIRSLNSHLRKHSKKTRTEHSNQVHNRFKGDSPLLETNDGLQLLVSLNGEFSEKKQFQCHICNLKFMKMSNLNRHLLIHGGERKFKCNYCLKSYFTAQTLKEHLLCHSGVKKYSCTTCDKKYMTSSLLKRHAITHNLQKPYICSYCCKNFKNATLYKRHFNVHKKDGDLQNDESAFLKPIVRNIVEESQQCNDINKSSIFAKNLSLDTQGTEDTNANDVENFFISDIHDGKVPQQLVPPQTLLVNKNDINAGVHTIFIDCNDVHFLNNLNVQVNSETGFFTAFGDLPEGNVFNVESFNDDIYNNQVFSTNHEDININNEIDLTNKILKSNSSSEPKLNKLNDDVSFYTNSELNLFNIVDPALESTNTCNNLTEDVNLSLPVVGVNGEEVSIALESRESGEVKKKTFVCDRCKAVFTNQTQLSEHMGSHGVLKKSGLNLHDCSFCSKSFKKQSDLIRHVRTHTGEKPFGCDKCDKKFSLKSTLLSHQKTHNPISHKHYNCIVCNSFFTSKSSLKVHMSVHTGNKAHECNFCSMKFRTAAHRKSHETNHHTNPTKPKKHKITNLLASVALGGAATEQQSFIGSYNDDKAVTNKELENILIVENQLPLPETRLDETNMITLNSTNKFEPIIIQQFPSNFLLTDNITPSLIYLNDETILTDVKCTDMQGLNNNNSKDNEKKTRNFECEHCGKKYTSKDVLRRHKKSHGINKKFPCNKCDKGFDLKEQWEKHEKTHVGFRPYSCIYCSNTFSKEHYLTTHMKRIHNISEKINNNLLRRDLS